MQDNTRPAICAAFEGFTALSMYQRVRHACQVRKGTRERSSFAGLHGKIVHHRKVFSNLTCENRATCHVFTALRESAHTVGFHHRATFHTQRRVKVCFEGDGIPVAILSPIMDENMKTIEMESNLEKDWLRNFTDRKRRFAPGALRVAFSSLAMVALLVIPAIFFVTEENMFNRALSFVLVSLLLNTLGCIAPAMAAPKRQKKQEASEKIKTCIAQLGVGNPNNRIEVKLRDGRKITGFVTSAEEDYFTVTEPDSRASINIRYNDVSKFKCGDEIIYSRIARRALVTAAFTVGLALLLGILLSGS